MKVYKVIKHIYKVQQHYKLEAVTKAQRAWSHWKIVYNFNKHLRKRFGN